MNRQLKRLNVDSKCINELTQPNILMTLKAEFQCKNRPMQKDSQIHNKTYKKKECYQK